MTIQQLLDMPTGKKTGGGFVLTVKHTHKIDKYVGDKNSEAEWIPSDGYTHEVTLTDKTGDILADLWTLPYNKVVRRNEIKIIVCEIQPSSNATGKKLLVHEWEKITCTADELSESEDRIYRPQQTGPDWEKIGRGKVKCRLIEAAIKNGIIALDPLSAEDKNHNKFVRAEIARNADWVMSEKDIYK